MESFFCDLKIWKRKVNVNGIFITVVLSVDIFSVYWCLKVRLLRSDQKCLR
jgi:hypothetical protein